MLSVKGQLLISISVTATLNLCVVRASIGRSQKSPKSV